jgi:hypothetical protein
MTQKLICKRNNIKVSKDGRIDCIEEGNCPKSHVAGGTSYCFRPDCLESLS